MQVKRFKIIVFILRTLVKMPKPARISISQEPPTICRLSLSRSSAFHSVTAMLKLVGMPKPSNGTGCRQGQPPCPHTHQMLNFYCICFKNRMWCQTEGYSCRLAGHWALPGEHSNTHRRTSRAQINFQIIPCMSSPRHTDMILVEKEQSVFPFQKFRLYRRERYSRRNWKHKHLRG